MPEDDASREKAAKKNGGKGTAFLPPLEFASIVLLMYFPALIQLGLVEDPAAGGFTENPELAKRNIDLLDLLKDKTKGNLDENEVKFLESALGQLKMAYLKKTDKLKM